METGVSVTGPPAASGVTNSTRGPASWVVVLQSCTGAVVIGGGWTAMSSTGLNLPLRLVMSIAPLPPKPYS